MVSSGLEDISREGISKEGDHPNCMAHFGLEPFISLFWEAGGQPNSLGPPTLSHMPVSLPALIASGNRKDQLHGVWGSMKYGFLGCSPVKSIWSTLPFLGKIEPSWLLLCHSSPVFIFFLIGKTVPEVPFAEIQGSIDTWDVFSSHLPVSVSVSRTNVSVSYRLDAHTWASRLEAHIVRQSWGSEVQHLGNLAPALGGAH